MGEQKPTALESIPVEQVDRQAAQGMLENAFRNAPDNCCDDVDFFEIAQHFARHRLRAHTEADQRVREALEEMLGAFAEGVVWNDEQRAVYERAAALTGSNPGADGGEG